MNEGKSEGFTLVELAIVLVIVGLLVGGIMVGADLIKAAALQKTASQLGSFNTAAATFRTKYNGIPGDLRTNLAANAGLSYVPFSSVYTTGWGDGNGILESSVSSPGTPRIDVMRSEITLFWRQLSQARLIPYDFPGITANTQTGTTLSAATTADFIPFFPQIVLRDGTFFYAFSQNGRNHYYLTGLVSGSGGSSSITCGTCVGSAFTPQEAGSLDTKLDDGYPASGAIYAAGVITQTNVPQDAGAAAASGVCVNSGTAPLSYNRQNGSYADVLSCKLVARAGF